MWGLSGAPRAAPGAPTCGGKTGERRATRHRRAGREAERAAWGSTPGDAEAARKRPWAATAAEGDDAAATSDGGEPDLKDAASTRLRRGAE